MSRAKVKVRPQRDEQGKIKRPLRYDASLVVNGRSVVSTNPQGYNRRHRARQTLVDVISGKYRDAVLDDPGAAALDEP